MVQRSERACKYLFCQWWALIDRKSHRDCTTCPRLTDQCLYNASEDSVACLFSCYRFRLSHICLFCERRPYVYLRQHWLLFAAVLVCRYHGSRVFRACSVVSHVSVRNIHLHCFTCRRSHSVIARGIADGVWRSYNASIDQGRQSPCAGIWRPIDHLTVPYCFKSIAACKHSSDI